VNLTLLRRIAEGETKFGLEHPKSAAAGAAFDALAAELFDLEVRGYVRIGARRRNGHTSKSTWDLIAGCELTPAGEAALLHAPK
jgi:hypothetical protein